MITKDDNENINKNFYPEDGKSNDLPEKIEPGKEIISPMNNQLLSNNFLGNLRENISNEEEFDDNSLEDKIFMNDIKNINNMDDTTENFGGYNHNNNINSISQVNDEVRIFFLVFWISFFLIKSENK